MRKVVALQGVGGESANIAEVAADEGCRDDLGRLLEHNPATANGVEQTEHLTSGGFDTQEVGGELARRNGCDHGGVHG